ncbi:hypothetical protein [Massilia haematophila]|uniref:Uncharacterized protein n=1 Tax=Massilia haematophila TaxID=457923 RepID=A0ABV7PQB9_9BURK
MKDVGHAGDERESAAAAGRAHRRLVLRDVLGKNGDEIAALRGKGVV